MSALTVFAVARRLDVRLDLRDGKLVAATKAGPLPTALLGLLKANRADVVAILEGRAQPPFGARRPRDCTEVQWDAALRGLHHFFAGGWDQQALALGWSHAELFNLPALWSQIRLTGVGWLIGEWNVLAVDGEAISVQAPWSPLSRLAFRRSDELHRAVAVAEPVAKVLSDAEAALVDAIVAYMHVGDQENEKVEVSATPHRLLTLLGQPADDDEAVFLYQIMMLADALFARGVELRFDPAIGHVVLGLHWQGCPRRDTLIGGTTEE
jgi:hypothetical protein